MVARLPLWPLLLAFLLALPAAPAWAKDTMGTIGLGDGYFGIGDLVVGRGSRLGTSGKFDTGNMVFGHVEAGAYFKVSGIGNLAGVEGGMDLGYDGIPYRPQDNAMSGNGILADLWIGFPVTLLNLGDGTHDWLRLSVAPGMGVSMVSAYLYVKAAAAARLPVIGDGEIAWYWWPDAVNYPFGSTNDALNAASLRFSLFLNRKLHGFLEWHRAQRSHDGIVASDPMVFDGITQVPGDKQPLFAPATRTAWESNLRLGLGIAF